MAAVPLTTGVAILVPWVENNPALRCPALGVLLGSHSPFSSGKAPAESTALPGANISGFILPSDVGP